ncbi:NADP-dependent aryl-alcohol dehydrogenase [Nocardiopsis terrae]|uniref:Aryl-alcohol dehydrogenase-like predicted oxidoreductase n=1 Tax=Nocardiopsis terrae TaxID=372655 RepID=A0ABR9HJ16_9ACTN|nr:aldo/keto reductase [Nocardiopsis terrae]MBE1458987.1 aryl-alcohol dehydrogenase-like predicted oxidoreductase [Nocardiopsis terrae]GHC87457.1 NADP-dependent aryl-alcohol dehydrogenase [Nocardiopsis terrae]
MNDTHLRRLGGSDLRVSPLNLGGNVFGWTADEATSFAVLDAYRESGGNFVDTADAYSAWAPGHTGGESERVIGAWLAARGHDDMVIATKVSQHPDFPGLSAGNIKAANEASLGRLGVEAVDLYYAHFDDPETPLAESAEAFSALVDQGRVRYVGLSNHSPERIREWLALCDENGWHRPVCVQPQYNLVERGIERDLVPLALAEDLALLPYFGLARGFLTGKYRPGRAEDGSPRAAKARAYLDDPRGERVLAALDAIAAERSAELSTVALAWLVERPGVASVLSSARNLDQLRGLLALNDLRLTAEETARLDEASA